VKRRNLLVAIDLSTRQVVRKMQLAMGNRVSVSTRSAPQSAPDPKWAASRTRMASCIAPRGRLPLHGNGGTDDWASSTCSGSCRQSDAEIHRIPVQTGPFGMR